jgi:hypothetical protein
MVSRKHRRGYRALEKESMCKCAQECIARIKRELEKDGLGGDGNE